jgi:hypothetical protein
MLMGESGDHMLNEHRDRLFLGSMSRTLTIVLSFLSISIFAKPQYPMTVVKEAWVNSNSALRVTSYLSCQSYKRVSKPQKQIMSYSSHGQKPMKIMDLSKEVALFAIQNTDDFYLNNVNLWIQLKRKNSTQFFDISEIMMHAIELPSVQLSQGRIVVQATTLTLDPESDNENWKIPNKLGQLYQTIGIGSMSAEGLELNILNCD